MRQAYALAVRQALYHSEKAKFDIQQSQHRLYWLCFEEKKMNTFDKTLRLLTLIAATFTVILSVKAVVDNGLGSWVSTSTGLFIAVLIASLLKTYNKGQVNFFGLIGALFAQLTLGRIFSTIHLESIDISTLSSLDPLMVAETGQVSQTLS